MNIDKQNCKEMKAYQAEIAPTCDKHPDNQFLMSLKQNLSRWIKRYAANVKKKKQEGCSSEFMNFWNACCDDMRHGASRVKAWEAWQLIDPDDVLAQQISISAKMYCKDIEREKGKYCHPSTFLSPTERRWESYEGIKEKIVAKEPCDICGLTYYKMISIKPEVGQWESYKACQHCQKYNNWKLADVNADRSKQ